MLNKYHFDLVCPRCGKKSETVGHNMDEPPHVNCGDCLMDHVEIVEMKVVKVTEINDAQYGATSHGGKNENPLD